MDLVIVTPARIAFLIVLVGTTIEALTEQSQRAFAALTARELNPDATIAAVVREAENQHLLDQSGADSVIHGAEAGDRLVVLIQRSDD